MVSVRLSRDETIETLTKCLEHVECPCETKGCYLADQHDCKHQLLGNVLELLKEQEAVEPITMQRMDGNFSFFVPYYLCGNCRYELVGKDVMFCHHCGRSVKWNDV